MSDYLIYWRDYRRNSAQSVHGDPQRRWHSGSRLLAELVPGDRLWLVTSGRGLQMDPANGGFLVEVWNVDGVIQNPGDDPAYPRDRYTHRVLAHLDPGATPVWPRRLTEATAGRLQSPTRPRETPAVSFDPAEIDPNRRALGVRQPWAELILRGEKTIEVRTLETNVRGPIYLYTSKVIADTPPAARAAHRHEIDVDRLPRGLLVGTVEILDCRRCIREDAAAACVPASLLIGKFSWTLGNPQRLDHPVRPRFLPYGVWFYPFRRRNAELNR